MKISRKEQRLLLYVLGVAMVLVVYFYVYNNLHEKNTALESEQAGLQAQVNKLEAWKENKETYIKKSDSMEQSITELLREFPADIKAENAIMYSRELETAQNISVSSVNIGEQNLLYTLGENEREKHLFETKLTLECTGTYANIKNAVESIQKNAEKRNVESISLTYDPETANLIGSMTVNLYSMAGTDMIYKKPLIPPMDTGVDNIFGQ